MKPSEITGKMLTPCGGNCAVCMSYLRKDNRCSGCRQKSNGCFKHRGKCVIKNCDKLKESGGKFCFYCEKFPCRRLKQLDERYRRRFKMSLIDNLIFIRKYGTAAFIKKEKKRWTCRSCGELLSCHKDECPCCGIKRNVI
jgi:hypothetical protein